MTDKKYELLHDQVIDFDGHKLRRIRALRNIGDDVPEGSLGGYVSNESNLSQTGECWIFQNAKAYGAARITEDVRLENQSVVFGDALVAGRTRIRGCSQILGNVELREHQEYFADSVLVNVVAEAIGQFVRNDNTIFSFQYVIEDKPYVLTVNSLSCSDSVAAKISLLKPGERLAIYTSFDGRTALVGLTPSGYLVLDKNAQVTR